MSTVSITLFGPPRILDDENTSTFRRKRGLALLAYLATNPGPQPRDVLLALFYPEFSADDARNNLRRDLSLLRKALPDGALDADRSTVTLMRDHPALTIDVVEFARYLEMANGHDHPPKVVCDDCRQQLQQAVEFYSADFLAGFSLLDSVDFDDWSLWQREQLRADLESILRHLVAQAEAAVDLEQAIDYSLRLIELAPADDAVVRRLMRLYADRGQTASALRQYEQLQERLRQDYGIEPEAETAALAKSIVSPAGSSAKESERREAPPAEVGIGRLPEPATLPAEPLSLIGRERELALLTDLLQQPDIPLVTIRGAGGAGKTTLALALAWQQRDALEDRVSWIDMDALESTTEVVTAVARSLGLSLRDVDDPWQRVLRTVRQDERLFVFDNFEHLLEASELLDDLLAAGPGLHIVATSRRSLERRNETVFPLEGLDTESEAVTLFLQRARQTDTGFDPDETELADITALAESVDGMPLALELAASWVATLTTAEIRAHVAGDADLLAAETADRPQRQQSMRRTLEHSWQLLDEAEQDVLARLSVFRGGFTHESATTVAGATLPVLRTLVNHSQIRHDAARKRYTIHELLRQFAAERLREKGDEAAARRAHSDYFGQWLAERQPLMVEGQVQLETLANIDLEFSNVQTGFLRAAKQAFPHLEDYLPGMWEYLFRQEHSQRGVALFRQALDLYPHEGTATADHLYIVYASQAQMRSLFRELSTERDDMLSRLSALDADMLSPYYRTLYRLAFLDRQFMREDQEAFDQTASDAIANARAAGNFFLEALALYTALHRDVDRSIWDQFAPLVRRTGDRYVYSVVLNFDGLEHLVNGHVDLAERQLRQAYRVTDEIDDVYGRVKIANRLSRILFVKREFEQAVALLEESAKQIDLYGFDPVRIEPAMELARIRLAQGDFTGAAEALQAHDSDYPRWVGVAYWLAYARREPLPDPELLLAAIAEWTLPSGHEVDQLIAQAMVELEDGESATAADTLAEALRHPAAPPWYATDHPVVKRLIKEIGEATQASH